MFNSSFYLIKRVFYYVLSVNSYRVGDMMAYFWIGELRLGLEVGCRFGDLVVFSDPNYGYF